MIAALITTAALAFAAGWFSGRQLSLIVQNEWSSLFQLAQRQINESQKLIERQRQCIDKLLLAQRTGGPDGRFTKRGE